LGELREPGEQWDLSELQLAMLARNIPMEEHSYHRELGTT
jgi:hypothetical protein